MADDYVEDPGGTGLMIPQQLAQYAQIQPMPASMISPSTDQTVPGNVSDQAASLGGPMQPEPGQPIDSYVYDPRLAPETNKLREAQWRAERGQFYNPGTAAVEEGWIPQAREGAVPDWMGPERDAQYGRERGLIRDEEAIRYAENDINREYARRRDLEAKQLAADKEAEVSRIMNDVNTYRQQLDKDMSEFRKLAAKGISPWGGLSSSGSNGEGQMVAALSMASAIASGNPQAVAQTDKMIDRVINNEVMKQKTQLDLGASQAESAYKRLLDRYGDQATAETALRMLLRDAAKTELDSMTLQMADPNTALWSQQQQAALDRKQLEDEDAFMTRAYGKVREQWQQGRAATAGGWRTDLDRWQKYMEGESQRSARNADTVGKWQENMAAQGGGENTQQLEEAFQSIPASIRKQLTDHENSLGMIDRVAKAIGAEGVDPNTGEIIGLDRAKEGDMPGFGAWDRFLHGATGGLATGDKADEVIRIRKELENMIIRARAGANLTGGEVKREAGIRSAIATGDDAEAFRLLAAELAEQRQNMMGTLLSPGQRRAVEWGRQGFQKETGTRGLGQGMSTGVPGARAIGRRW